MSSLVERYSRPAIVFHWLIGLLILINIGLALLDEAFGEAATRPMVDLHKSIGVTILGLAVMRLIWRATHRPPALPNHYRPWERRASHIVHWLFYLLIFAMPLSGWMHDSAWKAAPEIKMYWFGLFEWPRIGWIMNMDAQTKEHLHTLFGAIHENLALVLYLLFFLHVGAALKHQWFDKEKELQRMWPAR